MNRLALILLFAVSLPTVAQVAHPTVYLEEQNGFETYIAAAIRKKEVPIDVVTDPARATFRLKAAQVEIRQESGAGKVARCMFAYCIGIEDKATVSVELIETTSTKILWAYSVNKQRGGSKNQQSMAEAVAKHFKEFLSSSQPTVQAAIQAAADAPPPPPAPAAATVTPAQTAIPAAHRAETSLAKHESPTTEAAGQSTLGASFDGNLTIRHDGVTLARVIAGGSADRAGIRSGDAILAIDDHYLFTAQEMMEEIQRHKPGSRVSIRYRHYSAINEASVVVGTAQ